jgi:hypothetical protein
MICKTVFHTIQTRCQKHKTMLTFSVLCRDGKKGKVIPIQAVDALRVARG